MGERVTIRRRILARAVVGPPYGRPPNERYSRLGDLGNLLNRPVFRLSSHRYARRTAAHAANRRITVRTHRRLPAWSAFVTIAASATDSRVQRLASPDRRSELGGRPPRLLRRFASNPARQRTADYVTGDYVTGDELRKIGGRKSKHTWMIRQAPERVHRLVRDSHSLNRTSTGLQEDPEGT